MVPAGNRLPPYGLTRFILRNPSSSFRLFIDLRAHCDGSFAFYASLAAGLLVLTAHVIALLVTVGPIHGPRCQLQSGTLVYTILRLREDGYGKKYAQNAKQKLLH
jgi:hypothetical protein